MQTLNLSSHLAWPQAGLREIMLKENREWIHGLLLCTFGPKLHELDWIVSESSVARTKYNHPGPLPEPWWFNTPTMRRSSKQNPVESSPRYVRVSSQSISSWFNYPLLIFFILVLLLVWLGIANARTLTTGRHLRRVLCQPST